MSGVASVGRVTDDAGITRATVADAGELLVLQRAAYVSEAQLHGDPFLPPLVQTLEQLRADLRVVPRLKAVAGTRTVGSVRAQPSGEVLEIGRLAVAPDLQGRGLGTRLLAAAEALAGPGTTRFALFTGERSTANVRLYERLGYHVVRREGDLVHLEKDRPTLR